MKTAERTQLHQVLQGRRDAVATHWHRAIADTSFVPLSSREVEQHLVELTDQAITLLLAEEFERRQAQAIGGALVNLHYGHPEALGRTQEVLAHQLVADLPAGQVAALQPRLAALLGEVAAGFFGQARDMILTEQETIRGALLAARQQAEEALRESEARFRAIFDAAAIGMGIADANGLALESNPALQAMLGYSGEELRGKVVTAEFTHPDDAATDWQLYQELVLGQRDSFQIEKRFYRKGGRLIWTHLTVSLVRDAEGHPQLVIAMMENITERKQAEETVKQLNADLERRVAERTAELTAANQELASEIARRTQAEAERIQLLTREQAARAEAEAAQRRLAFLAEASNVLTSSLDYKTTLINVADLAVPHLADWCAVDVVAEDGEIQRLAVAHVDLAKLELVRELRDYYPPDSDALSGVRQVLRTGQPEFLPTIPDSLLAGVAGDANSQRLLGALRPTSRIVVPLVARERILGTISLVWAESGRRYGPADLALAEDLARRAAVATDNARLYAEAQQALAERDEFLSVAAHELKTPVTNVIGFTELTTRQLDSTAGPDPLRMRRALGAIDRESTKLSTLVSQLLDISRIEAGRLVLDRAMTDVTQLVEEAVASAGVRTGQHTITVRAPAPVRAFVDPLRLEQVVANLLSNAVKYSPAGGPIDVEVAAPDADTVVIAVRDRGAGVAPEHRQRIFERFYRIQPRDSIAGMGLGLYISRQIAELHGGHIEAEFPADGGSRFIVSLPTGLARAERDGAT